MNNNKIASNEAMKAKLLEDAKLMGGWTEDDRMVQFFADQREVGMTELTMLFRDSTGTEALVYIVLMPSAEPRHYDAWMRKPGEDSMHLLLHCEAADQDEMLHQLSLRLPELHLI